MPRKYSKFARVLHWMVAALVAAQFTVAWTMPEIERDTLPVGLIAWHVGIGLAILVATCIRLGWRTTHQVPASSVSLWRPLRYLSRATHYSLYATLLVLPFLGWANASARGWRFPLVDGIVLPGILAKGAAIGIAAGDVHKLLSTVLLVLVVLHVAGALFHAFIIRDDTLQRMT